MKAVQRTGDYTNEHAVCGAQPLRFAFGETFGCKHAFSATISALCYAYLELVTLLKAKKESVSEDAVPRITHLNENEPHLVCARHSLSLKYLRCVRTSSASSPCRRRA
jgi:hypothetical protein